MKKLLIFLMILIPLAVIFIVNVTVDIVSDIVTISVDNITLDVEDYVANINDKFKLNATIHPEGASDKKVIWSSSDESIATVDDNGNVSFKAFGAVNIIATSGDGLKTAMCRINITDTRVHNIAIYSEKTLLEVGETTQVWANVIPATAENQNYVLKSSNEDVLSLNASGIATAKKVGSAIVTAISQDGNYEASIEINVQVPVDYIELNPNEEFITIGNPTLYLSTSITPSNATNKKILYTSSDPSTATVSSTGLVSFSKIGEVVIIATSEDGNHTDSIKISYTGGYPVSLNLENKYQSFDLSLGKQYFTINYTLEPSEVAIKNITFESSDSNIVTVNKNGYVEILKGGSANITIKVQIGDNAYLYDTILINAKQNVEEIKFDKSNIVCAENHYQLSPIILPDDATEISGLSFKIISGNAIVSEQGEVTFNESGEVVVQAYLTDNPEISAQITLIYTGGYPSDIELINEKITLNVGESDNLSFVLYPLNSQIKDYRFEIVENSPNEIGTNVVSLNESGKVTALFGGTALVRLFVKTASDVEIFKDYKISVNQSITDISLEINEEIYQNNYISANNVFSFNTTIAPLDANLEEILYSLSNNEVAKIINNQIYFNKIGKTILTATLKSNPNISTSVNLWYTGGYAVASDITNIPSKLIFGDDAFDITLKNYIPANATNKSFKVLISNQNTLNGDDVFGIEYNSNSSSATINILNSGNATLSILLAGSTTPIHQTDIIVEQKVERLEFLTASGETPNTSIALKCNVYPINSTVKEVNFTLDESYSNIAYIKDSTLYFYPSTNAKETVVVIATLIDIDKTVISKSIEITSTFGVIDAPEGNVLNLNPNNTVNLDYSSEISSGLEISFEVLNGLELIDLVLENNKLQINALSPGTASVKVYLKETLTNTITKILANLEINIYENITNIDVSSTDLTEFDNIYYTSESEISLNIDLTPTSCDLNNINCVISDENIASFDVNTGKLTFFKFGIIELNISTKMGNVSKSIKIQYTNKSVTLLTNLNNSSNLFNINSTNKVEIISFVPNNLNLQIINIKEVTLSGNSDLLNIYIQNNIYYITANKSGNTNIEVEFSDGTVINYPISVLSFIEKIDFSFNSLETASKNITLNPILTPANPTDKRLKFVSSDESIATVNSEGIVSFKKRGTVEITVISVQNELISKTISLTSTFGEISDFELNVNELNLTVGETRLLSVIKVFPTDAIKPTFTYEILSQNSNNNSNLNVIEIKNNEIVAKNGGTAIVEVRYFDSLNNLIFKQCVINVTRDLTSLEISPSLDLSVYQNYFVTSCSELELLIRTSPIDATINDLKLTLNNNTIATINNNILKFNSEGIVKITATSGNVSNSIIIRYAKSAVSYDLTFSKTGTISGSIHKITLNAGEVLKLNASNVIPSDIYNPEFQMVLINNIPNNNGDIVCSTSENQIIADKGGIARFKIYYGNKEYAYTIEIEVIKKVDKIVIDNEIITPNEVFALNPSILPYDASYKNLKYTLTLGDDVASISDSGVITFTAEGSAEILIDNEFSGVKTSVIIKYSKGYKTIAFDCPDYVFIGKTLNLSVKILPETLNSEPVVFVIPEQYKAYGSINNGVFTPNKKEGIVKIQAYLKNYPDVKTEITINIYAIITDINMFDDKSKDNVGIQGNRVYGTTFITLTKDGEVNLIEYKNSFSLDYTIKYNSETKPSLLFTSSNAEIATVENGIVTILQPGTVTIKIQPVKQLSNNQSEYVYDSYTFTFVSGINIYNEDEFSALSEDKQNFILRNELSFYDKTFTLAKEKTIYGNGYKIFAEKTKFILQSNTSLINCHFRSYNFSPDEPLSVLNKVCRDTTIALFDAINVNIEYCLIENSNRGIDIVNSEANIKGCIIANTYLSGIWLSSNADTTSNKITVDSCVFENNMLGAISNMTFNSAQSRTKSFVTINGFLDMYNWIPLSVVEDINYDNADVAIFKDIINSKVSAVLNRNKQLFKTYNDQQYIHMGILGIEALFNFEGFGGVDVVNSSEYTFNTKSNPYSLNVLYEPISNGYLKIFNTSLTASSTSPIQPGVSYKTNAATVYEKIRRYTK